MLISPAKALQYWLGVVCVLCVDAAARPIEAAPLARIDLSKGVLSQTNCQVAIGCGHPRVKLTRSTLVSTETTAAPPQHILTLALKGSSDQMPVKPGPHVLALAFELTNPSGQWNNAICVTAIDGGQSVQRCARASERVGVLLLPLTSSSPTAIYVRFGLMPFSGGHAFRISNVRLIPGVIPSFAPRARLDLARGRLRQIGCVTPIGCDHPFARVQRRRSME